MGADYTQLSPTGPELRPGWSQHLVMDVALGSSEESILEAHDLMAHQYDQICSNPVFVLQVKDMRTQLEKEGASFRLKAQLQADFYMAQVHKMIMDEAMDPRVRTRLIEDVVRWGGLDAPASVNGEGAGIGGFNITINLGASQRERGITLDGDKT
jgi:hypothetical protein